MKAESDESAEADIRSRAQVLLADEFHSVWCATDKLFIPVLIIQWLAEMAISLWFSTRTWEGSASLVHPHVWEASIWGGIIISLPCFLAYHYPGRLSTRLVIATAQAISSALLIHLIDGRIEIHFHVFASLALLAFYRDGRVIVLSSIIVTLDLLVRGIWWPESVYGTDVADPWRFAEHTTWLVIEDTFLLIFCGQRLAEMTEAAERQARLEDLNTRIETKVVQRTESLRLSEQRFELALRGTRIGIFDWDLRTDLVYWSARVYEMLGINPIGLDQTFEAVISRLHPDERARVLTDVGAAIDRRRSFHQEFRLRSDSGEYLWVECRGNCVVDDDGGPYRFTGGLIDVTARKQVEAELLQRDEQLRQSQKLEAIGSLAGGIAHEFNNLLQTIRGYTNYAMKGLSAEDLRRQDLRQVLLAADRAAALTRQLLGFSRHQALDLRELHPEDVIHDVLAMLRPLIGETIEIVTHISEGLGTVSADPILLQQMILNLCINARDALPDGGRVTLTVKHQNLSERYCELHSLEKPGPYLLISVADNGCGMSQEIQQRIFEPFFTTKEVGAGTGLGLSMVYGIIQKHRGSITVYSEPDLGTTFNVLLPINAESLPQWKSPELPTVRRGTETILVAEDEKMVRELTVRILADAGYSVLSAADGVEALEVFDRYGSDISLALIDAVMPKLSGHGLSDELRCRNSELPIVFCTGYDPEVGQLQFITEGEIPLVQKPFEPEILLRTVRETLDAQFLTVEAV